jgi:hypothetical protein
MPLSRLLAVAMLGVVIQRSTALSATPIDPNTPARLAKHKDVQPLLAGYVDPTLPPYSAAGDGATDDATALQQAIDDAYVARMTVLLPANRTFMLSTQLRMIQPLNIPVEASASRSLVVSAKPAKYHGQC